MISLTEYNQDEFHLLHAQTVENTMRYFARELGFADEEDFWGIDEKIIHATASTAMLGWTLEDLIQRIIDALKTFQD
ncbi:hypothetical protein [Dorea longicatena]|uniref:hypothetical protein n=1 Tax=Dorea TaxID=189330 RepID=UPI001FA99221|nr:hypothetical protein [Dorea longicatena]